MAIVSRIREENLNNRKDPIPQSDTIFRKLFSDLGETDDRLRYYIRVLNEAHYIFVIHVIEPDEKLLINGLEGYVVAESDLIIKVRDHAYLELEKMYENQFYKRKQASTIIRELMTDVRKYNNTPLGKYLNVAVMLQQFEHIMEAAPDEYTNSYKTRRLNELIPDLEATLQTDAITSYEETASEIPPARAVDTEAYQKLQEADLSGKWGESVKKFGVQFLVRIHLRKHEYDRIRYLIKKKKIAEEQDLRFIRDALKKMESRTEIDSVLKMHKDEIVELRRLAQLKMNQIILARKEYEDYMATRGQGTSGPKTFETSAPETFDQYERSSAESANGSTSDSRAAHRDPDASDSGFEHVNDDDLNEAAGDILDARSDISADEDSEPEQE